MVSVKAGVLHVVLREGVVGHRREGLLLINNGSNKTVRPLRRSSSASWGSAWSCPVHLFGTLA